MDRRRQERGRGALRRAVDGQVLEGFFVLRSRGTTTLALQETLSCTLLPKSTKRTFGGAGTGCALVEVSGLSPSSSSADVAAATFAAAFAFSFERVFLFFEPGGRPRLRTDSCFTVRSSSDKLVSARTIGSSWLFMNGPVPVGRVSRACNDPTKSTCLVHSRAKRRRDLRPQQST
jgi:hypothetical protein